MYTKALLMEPFTKSTTVGVWFECNAYLLPCLIKDGQHRYVHTETNGS